MSDIAIECVVELQIADSRRCGFLTRLQAHGAAANLLDLYALADIAETEMFGRGDRDPLASGFDERFGEGDRDPIVSKFASSAAHLAGRPLIAAKTGTWMAEHFCETLEELKCLADLLFAAGVDYVIYHGSVYSPDDAAWPGWLFYASSQLHPRNPLWREIRTLNDSIACVQSALRAGRPDHDLLVYWPMHDLWMTPPPAGKPAAPIACAVHHPAWLRGQPVGRSAAGLWRRGVAFDFVSDRLLERLEVGADGSLRTPEGVGWRAVWVPPCATMPETTLARLADLGERGAAILWEDRLPEDVPGWGRLDERRARLREARGRAEARLRASGSRCAVGGADGLLALAGCARRRTAPATACWSSADAWTTDDSSGLHGRGPGRSTPTTSSRERNAPRN